MAEEVCVIAKYDYTAAEDTELDLRKNEKLVVLDRSGNWWRVQNQLGRSGYVPSNFLKTYKPSIFSSLKKIIRKPSRGESDPSTGGLSQSRQNGVSDTPDCQAFNEMTVCDMFTAVARYAYEAQKPDELSLARGDTVVVREKSSDGWWRGRHATTGLYGWFPSNYVEVHSSDGVAVMTASPNSTLDDSCRRPRTTPAAGPIRRAVAVFRFDATNDDELSIEENERLDILDDGETSTDAGWLRARNAQGDVGLVPQEFIRIISGGSSDSPPSGAAGNTASGGSLSNSSAGQGSLGAERSSSGISLSGTSRNGSAPFAGRDWYFGNISRAECEELMNQFAENGDFLIRESETNVSNLQYFNYLFYIYACEYL
jgi:hypothetical protein